MIKDFKPLENNCSNCKFYKAYYYKYKGRVRRSLIGRCTKKRNKLNLVENSWSSTCNHWESNEEVLKENSESIKTTIRNMRDSLLLIESFLATENESPKNSN